MFTINTKTVLAIGAVAVAGYFVAKKFFSKKETTRTATVKAKSWVKKTPVERYDETTGSGWTVPDGAYDIHSERRLRRSNAQTLANSVGDAFFGDGMTHFSYQPSAVYDTWYTYKLKSWVRDSVISQSGDGEIKTELDNPIEGLWDGKSDPEIGIKRLRVEQLTCNILAVDDETGEFISLPVDKDSYSVLEVGEKITYRKTPIKKWFVGIANGDQLE